MNQQYNLTEAKSIPWGILVSEEDVKNNTFTLKKLSTRECFDSCTVEKAAELIKG